MKKWKLVSFCEIDKYATKSYCAIHNVESLNLGDITKVDETKLESFNMICGGSPCQDFSTAGKRKGSVWTCKDCEHEYNPLTVHWSERDKCPCCGSNDIEKTRSSLLVEYLRVIRANKPNFGMYENVKNIVGKQFKDTFKMFTDELDEYGYNVHWKVLDAKDYGIPQHRERVYLIFIKKELDNGKFTYPEPFDNGMRLKDILEDTVNEKFYISNNKFIQTLHVDKEKNGVIKVGITDKHQKGGVYSVNGLSTTLLATSYKQPVQIKENNESLGRIRKLTPREYFKLQGFSDENFKAAEKVVSNSQLYKQAGNSIVVDVLYYILIELYKAMPYLFDDLKLSSFFSGIGAFECALDRLYEMINKEECDKWQ